MKLNTFKKVIFCMIVLLFLAGNVSARLFSNNTEVIFIENVYASTMVEAINGIEPYTIKDMIIISASHFLKGQSYIHKFSEGVELADLEMPDFNILREDLNIAMKSIYNTYSVYCELIAKSSTTPCKEDIIKKLATFDYKSFQEKNGLLKEVVDEVKKYLINGDVRGAYSHIALETSRIFYILDSIRVTLNADVLPDNNIMWSLNQKCAVLQLFGQYLSMVFAAL